MRALSAVALLALVGCADIIGIEDLEPPGGGPGGTCFANASYGSPTPLNPVAERNAAGDQISYSAQLNTDAQPDGLTVTLVDGSGVYSDPSRPIEPVTNLGLTGAEANLATCGVCVVLFADLDVINRSSRAMYMAMGGSISITQVSPRLRGTLSDLTLVEVTVDGTGNTQPVANGCASHVASFTFDTAVTQTAQ